MLSLFLYLFFNRQAYEFSGYTMGTTYKVVIYARLINSEKLREMKVAIEDELYKLNLIFSTFEPNSEVSKLNSASVNVKYDLGDELYSVLSLAKETYLETNGYYDPTVDPLVRLWGFGRENKYTYPSTLEIESMLSFVGYDKLIIADNSVVKKENVTIDLASIAKGYAVDRLVAVLTKFEQKDFMVEIGGELYVKGDEFYRDGWDVIIVNPENNNSAMLMLRLKNKGVATSGSYRNFRLHEGGKKYHHIIDVKTGYPVFNDLLSVTIVADNVAKADALATGIFVMGTEAGLQLINSLKDVEGVLIEKREKGLKVIKSSGL